MSVAGVKETIVSTSFGAFWAAGEVARESFAAAGEEENGTLRHETDSLVFLFLVTKVRYSLLSVSMAFIDNIKCCYFSVPFSAVFRVDFLLCKHGLLDFPA